MKYGKHPHTKSIIFLIYVTELLKDCIFFILFNISVCG